METARPARPDDRAACLALVGRALDGAASMRGGRALQGDADAESLLERWTTSAGTALLVGEYEGAVVGLAAVSAAEEATGGRHSGRIECCYVEEGARGVGVGTALMEAAVAWCAARGCTDVDAMSLPGDRATKQRLEAAGFTARLLTLTRRLG